MEQNGMEQQEQFRKKCLTESGIAYSASAVVGILLAFLIGVISSAAGGEDYTSQNWYLYLAYLSAQIAFAAAAALYFYRSREPVRAVLKLPHPKYFLIALLLQFGLLFSLTELNGLFSKLLELIGYHSSEDPVPVPDLGGWNLLPAILVIGLLPAVFEEVIFRGILSRNMHAGGWGLLPTLLISGGMFALFHGRPEQTVYQFLCGVCFSLVALRAGSILPTMLAHFCNNTVILILSACGMEELNALSSGGYLALVISSAVCLTAVLAYLIVWDKSGNQRGKIKYGGEFAVAAGTGLLVCLIEWLVNFAVGFFHG